VVAAFLLSLALSIDDYIITSFVAGSVSTFPREIFDSAKVEIPPQVHVLATLIMLIAIAVLVGSAIVARRRAQRA
jgi:spermidine/putrescine transport system permease protein